MNVRIKLTLAVVAAALTWTGTASAHCDTLDGPVVGAARSALEAGNPDFALVWVQKGDEKQVRAAFAKAMSARKAGGAAKEKADTRFFETLVRVHRAGEGAPYTGLKPAGRIDPAVAAADQALQAGKPDELVKLVSDRVREGLHRNFEAVVSKKDYDPKDVAAGRAYVGAYVEYVHFAERLYEAAGPAAHAAHGTPAHAVSTARGAAAAHDRVPAKSLEHGAAKHAAHDH